MDKKLTNQSNHLQRYLFSSNVTFLQEVNDVQTLKDIAVLVTFYELPINVMNFIDLCGAHGQPNFIRLHIELKKLNVTLKTIQCISDIIATNT